MILINNYQLRDYPCIYYLSKLADMNVQLEFLCGLGSIFRLDEAAVSASSILFAHVSKGVLYEKEGFSISDVKEINSPVFKNPLRDCRSLTKSNIVKKHDLPTNCCVICPLSHTYANDRIDVERICLRYTIDTGKLISLQSNCFASIVSIAPGNDISEFPLISFNRILNEYFNLNDPHGPYELQSLSKSFSAFLSDKMAYNSNMHAIVKACVERELGLIYSTSYSGIKETEISLYQEILIGPYKYSPPKFFNPKEKQTNPKKAISSKKTLQFEYEDISLLQPLNIPDEYQKPDESEIVSDDNNVSDNSNSNVEINVMERVVDDIRENPDIFIEPTHGDTILDIDSINETINVENKIKNERHDLVPVISYPSYSISKTFESEIGDCTTNDAKTVLQFIVNTCSSSYICVESVTLNGKHGLLFMTTSPIRFYFFDLASASSGYLYPALSDAYKITFLSLNPMPVISMLSKLGFKEIRIESLTGLYCLINKISDIYDIRDMFDDELSISNDGKLDFYQFYMPFYEENFNSLWKKLQSINDKSLIEAYKRGLKLDNLLGHNYDLSAILFNHRIALSGIGSTNYNLLYNDDIPIVKEGIMYVVNIQNFKQGGFDNTKHFLEDVCIGVFLSPVKCVRYSYLLSVTETGLTYYTTSEGDMFFDVLLNVIRRKFKKAYNEMPLLQTYRIEYK